MHKQLRLRLFPNNALREVWNQLPERRQNEIHDHCARLIASAARAGSGRKDKENADDQDD